MICLKGKPRLTADDFFLCLVRLRLGDVHETDYATKIYFMHCSVHVTQETQLICDVFWRINNVLTPDFTSQITFFFENYIIKKLHTSFFFTDIFSHTFLFFIATKLDITVDDLNAGKIVDETMYARMSPEPWVIWVRKKPPRFECSRQS